MDWANERYVKLYTRDSADWLALSFDAQALFCLILRKVDRAGILDLGRHGKKAIAIALGQVALWDRLAPALDELLTDGCIQIIGTRLLIRNFIEAQEARKSNAQAQRDFKERRRALSNPPLPAGNEPLPGSNETQWPVIAGNSPEETRRYKNPPYPPSGGNEPLPKRTRKPKAERPLPFTIAEMLAVLHQASKGRVVIEPYPAELSKRLTQVIRDLEASGITLEQVRAAGKYIASWPDKYLVDCAWIATRGKLAGAIGKASAKDHKPNGTSRHRNNDLSELDTPRFEGGSLEH